MIQVRHHKILFYIFLMVTMGEKLYVILLQHAIYLSFIKIKYSNHKLFYMILAK